MNKRIIQILISFILFSCNKKPANEEKLLLIATDKSSFINKTELTFKIFSDSTYNLNITVKANSYDKIENFKGKLKIEKDTLDFFPSWFEYSHSEKAILKNGFIEFINGKVPFRMKIDSTKLKINNIINFSKFKNYAVFNYIKENENDKNESFDLNEIEIYDIENLLKTEFNNKSDQLFHYDKYLKQIVSYKNKHGEKYVRINCYCQSRYNEENFRKYIIQMHDGGNCNIYILLNLTKKKIEVFDIAGMA